MVCELVCPSFNTVIEMAEGNVPHRRSPEHQALKDAFGQLHDTICPEGVTATLYANDLILEVEADTIRSKATTYGKNEELLFAISKRSAAQVVQFCQFLLEKQIHCGRILKEGID